MECCLIFLHSKNKLAVKYYSCSETPCLLGGRIGEWNAQLFPRRLLPEIQVSHGAGITQIQSCGVTIAGRVLVCVSVIQGKAELES